ncbi:TPM domain-containing protein [Sphingobacterium sp. N143]|uniref:TPM domain-containing protein n=1 Tax=Sphingobacterium sp. N143 TaxID=2746727 RepID=UPI0025775CC2|nr:TPM domain-containing protein [Sphingobacterium sp. N143]MDM1295506.1 TPM domain-containing protein [Sphingobacterium sp. N143]
MGKLHRFHIFLLFWVGTCLTGASAFGQSIAYTVDNIPSPKQKGQDYFVSNPDGILSSGTVAELDGLSTQIEAATKSEFAIVLVNDYVGDSDFEFALKLFNAWGIGKKESNNGLLLFIAKDRREYRFITGYGMEGTLPDAYLKRIGEKYLVPNFRNGNYDQGVLEASRFIKTILTSPDSRAELERLMPEATPIWSFRSPILRNSLLVLALFALCYIWLGEVTRAIKGKLTKKSKYFPPLVSGCGCMGMLMFASVFICAFALNNFEIVYQWKNLPYFVFIFGSITLAMKYNASRTQIINSYRDEENIQQALRKFRVWGLIPLMLSPLALFDLFGINKRIRRNELRLTPPDGSGRWLRMNKDDADTRESAYLDKGQLLEEKIGSRSYEIWVDQTSNETKLVPWDENAGYMDCPQCHYRTFETGLSRTIRSATYNSQGLEERFDKCKNCGHRVSHGEHTIPVKVRSSSSSSSGGGSGSSGGGSFGGGSSGGGGAGGRW